MEEFFKGFLKYLEDNKYLKKIDFDFIKIQKSINDNSEALDELKEGIEAISTIDSSKKKSFIDFIDYLKNYSKINEKLFFEKLVDVADICVKESLENLNLVVDKNPTYFCYDKFLVNEEGYESLIKKNIDLFPEKIKELINPMKVGDADFKKVPGWNEKKEKDFLDLKGSDPQTYIKILLGIRAFANIKETKKEFKKVDELYDFFNNLEDNGEKSCSIWYRGQTNSDWGLMPSIYRGINRDKSSVLVTDELIEDWYEESGVNSKLENLKLTFDSDLLSKYTYLQHAISFSPLVDFTSDWKVALSFALRNFMDYHFFINDNSAIYILISLDDRLVDKKVDTRNILMKKRGWGILDVLYFLLGLMWSPEVVKSDKSNNDRMKYQHGKLLSFNNTVIINDEFDTSSLVKNGQLLIKAIIDTGIKNKILKDERFLYLKEKYSNRNLMDPYLYMNSL